MNATEPSPRRALALLPLLGFAALCLWEGGLAVLGPRRAPTPADWQAAAAQVRAGFQPGDLIVIAPAWAAPLGRMAFTNYITQSLIMTTIFWSGRGFGLYGEVDRSTLMAIVAAVWVLQLVWSSLWLARFRMGPLEWAWRRLSYGKPIAMAKGAPA